MALRAVDLVETLRSHRLVSDEALASIETWLAANPPRSGSDTGSPTDRLLGWLREQSLLTPFQIDLLERGKGEKLRLGDYVLLDRIGTGRMAGVYKGRKGGQVVALKVLPPGKAKEAETLARFQREGRLALRLKHPNVVRTFEIGEHDRLHFISMEYLEGETLEDLLQRRGKLPPEELTRLLRQALEGLQHLHEQGVVHRDLKPANLMLVTGKSDGKRDATLDATLKILDVGLGKTLFDEVSESQADLTGAGDLLGTAACMAPEQARDARRADVRSDLYSLGCVAYHALTGQPPFIDSNATNVLMMHATRPPRPLREIDPGIPAGLTEVISRMLAKDPAHRFATPREAIQSLETGAGGGASTPKDLSIESQRKPDTRRLIAGAAAALVAGVCLVAWIVARREPPHRPEKTGNGNTTGATAQPVSSGEPDDPIASLRKRLKDEDAARRAAAVDALVQLGDAAQPAYSDLVAARKDADSTIAQRARIAVAHLKPQPSDLPVLRSLLREPAATDKAFAAAAIGSLGTEARGELGYLRLLSHDESDEVREAADKSVADLEPQLVPLLIQELRDPAPDVRRAAAIELGAIRSGAERALPNLIEATADDNGAVRVAAADALVELGPDAVPVLVECLKDKDSDRRRTAITCLGRIGPDAADAVPALLALGPGDPIARDVREAVVRIGPRSVPALVKAFDAEPTPEGQEFLRSLLLEIGPEALAALQTSSAGRAKVQAVVEEVTKKATPRQANKRASVQKGRAGVLESTLRDWFEAADANDDNQLDREELAHATRGSKAKPFDHAPDGKPAPKLGPRDFSRFPDFAYLTRLDLDGDGFVSQTEHDDWCRKYADLQIQLENAREKVSQAERRLLEPQGPGARLTHEATLRDRWGDYHSILREAGTLAQAEWLRTRLQMSK